MLSNILLLIMCTIYVCCHPIGPPWAEDSIVYRYDVPWNGKTYSFGFKTLFGVTRKEKAQLTGNVQGVKYLQVDGEYSYPNPDGSIRKVFYNGNDRGYRTFETTIGKEEPSLVKSENYNADPAEVAEASQKINIFSIINSINGLPAKDENKPVETVKQKYEQANILDHAPYARKLDVDRIVFPDEFEDNVTDLTNNTIGDDDHIIIEDITTTTEGDNSTGTDYDYDGFGFRIGVPPAVLASLLGGG